MRLYKIVTYFKGNDRYEVPKEVSPDIDNIVEIVDLGMNSFSIKKIKEVLFQKFPDEITPNLCYSDSLSILEYGRTILFRDGNYFHYIVDFDHFSYIDLKRDFKLGKILN